MTDNLNLRKAAFEVYEAPFRFEHGYIFDAKGRTVSDDSGEGVIARVRGWGRISYMENAEALQDEVGAMIAEALTQFWNRRTEPAGSAEPGNVRADVRANDIDDRYAGRLALLLECMLLDPNYYWNEAASLLDEYKAEWDKINPQPPLFMGEPMPPDRKARLLALKAERDSK